MLAVGVFEVEVAAVGEDVVGVDAPGVVVLAAVVPPVEAGAEVFKLHGLGFGVVFAARWQGLFVVPDPLRWAGAVKEEEVGGNAGVGGEDAVW